MCVSMNVCVHVSECICLCVFVGVLLMNVLSHADTEQSQGGGTKSRADRSFHGTLLKLRPAESFSLGLSSCS